jgi:hypothetical protein
MFQPGQSCKSCLQKPRIEGQKPTAMAFCPPRWIAKPRVGSVQMTGYSQETGFKSATATSS